MATEPVVAAPAAPPTPNAAVASPPASAAAAAPAGDSAPTAGATPHPGAAEPAVPAKIESPAPSLLAGADAGKRDNAKPDGAKPNGAAPPDATATPGSKSPGAADQASAAKPADGTPPPEGPKEPAKPPEPTKPEAGKDGEPKAPDAAAKDALAEKPPATPVYTALKLPDGFKLDDVKLKDFDTLLGAFETTAKAEHGQVESLRQSLVDFYHTEVQRIGREVVRHQVDVWNRMKEGWINDLKADPQLGGNRIDTTLGNAKYAYESMLGLDKQQQDGLMAILDNAGVSSHPLLIRALHNLYERFREPEPVPPNPIVPPKGKEAGNRGWYSAIDGVNLPQG